MDEAETAFEAAVEVATACGNHFFAALALRDLCKHVLEAVGRGEEGKRRLEQVRTRASRGLCAFVHRFLGARGRPRVVLERAFGGPLIFTNNRNYIYLLTVGFFSSL